MNSLLGVPVHMSYLPNFVFRIKLLNFLAGQRRAFPANLTARFAVQIMNLGLAWLPDLQSILQRLQLDFTTARVGSYESGTLRNEKAHSLRHLRIFLECCHEWAVMCLCLMRFDSTLHNYKENLKTDAAESGAAMPSSPDSMAISLHLRGSGRCEFLLALP
jgi:hypothetical protein